MYKNCSNGEQHKLFQYDGADNNSSREGVCGE